MMEGCDVGLGKLIGSGSIFRNIANSRYPKCKIFSCKRSHSGTVKDLCCFYCEKKAYCLDPCLNDPAKCRMCVMLQDQENKNGGDVPCGR